MKRALRLPIQVRDNDEQVLVKVDFDRTTVLQWCMELVLLQQHLVSSTSIVQEDNSFSLEISLLSPALHSRGEVKWRSNGCELVITTNELDYWIVFFLKYYRDGLSDVDHIDVDIVSDKSRSLKGLFLVFKVPDYLPPVSKEEARRRLGL